MHSTHTISRRSFVGAAALAGAGMFLPANASERNGGAATGMRLCLSPGSIGVKADQPEAIRLAAQHGFDAVEPYGSHLAGLSPAQRNELLADLKGKGLVWGAAGLPVDFRRDDARCQAGLATLRTMAPAMEKAGVTRVGTWLSPAHDSLTYLENFKMHAARLRDAATILRDHGQRLGLEYVGTFTLWTGRRYPFIHTMKEALDLIAEIGTGNVGLVLDSWHWWQAGDTADDLLALRNEDVVSVDLNDAPTDVPKHEQRDGSRELPAATGVIDIDTFVGALARIGYDGPARAEPFNRELNDLENDDACARTILAMRKATGR